MHGLSSQPRFTLLHTTLRMFFLPFYVALRAKIIIIEYVYCAVAPLPGQVGVYRTAAVSEQVGECLRTV